MKIQKQVEVEYGQPFWNVVKQFADDGESITATAAILGYAGHGPFMRLVKKYGKQHWFRPAAETNGAIEQRANPPDTPARRAAVRKASELNPCYKRVEYKAIVDTIAGHARRAGISRYCAYKRIRKGLPLDKVFSARKLTVTPKSKPSVEHLWRG